MLEIPGISSEFYEQVLHLLANTPPAQVFWSVGTFILQQASEHIDPQQQSMALMVSQCMPPSRQKVRSLRGVMGIGTAPWGGYLNEQTIILGSESLAGRAILSGRPLIIQNMQENIILPGPSKERVASTAVYPLRRSDAVAGCFTVCSSRPNAFSSFHLNVLPRYGDLLMLLFAPQDFYPMQDIALAWMPPSQVQEPYIATFRQRVMKIMKGQASQQQHIPYAKAELMAWQQLESELASLALKQTATSNV